MNRKPPPPPPDFENDPAFDENPEWTQEDFIRARPADEVHPPHVVVALVRKGGRPPLAASERKQLVTMRLAPDLLARLRATGPGWQTRAEEILRRGLGL